MPDPFLYSQSMGCETKFADVLRMSLAPVGLHPEEQLTLAAVRHGHAPRRLTPN